MPKQFLRIEGRTILEHAVGVFDAHASVSEIIIVAPRRFCGMVAGIVRRGKFRKVSHVVAGGAERQESVRLGLAAFDRPPSVVLVHDGVRPLVGRRVIDAVIRAAERFGAAVVGTPVTDTIKVVKKGGIVGKTLSRRSLWAVQTPQGFRFRQYAKAHASARTARFLGTDDASLMERMGIPVKIVKGDVTNIKITTPNDLRVVRFLIENSEKKRSR